MKIPNSGLPRVCMAVSLARIVSEDSQRVSVMGRAGLKSSKDS